MTESSKPLQGKVLPPRAVPVADAFAALNSIVEGTREYLRLREEERTKRAQLDAYVTVETARITAAEAVLRSTSGRRSPSERATSTSCSRAWIRLRPTATARPRQRRSEPSWAWLRPRRSRISATSGGSEQHSMTLTTFGSCDFSEPELVVPLCSGVNQYRMRAVVPFLNGAGPSTGWSERFSAVAGGFGAASGAGRGQHAAPGARSARTNGVEAVSWSTQDLLAGVVGCAVVVIGFSLGGAERGSRSCQPFLRVVLHEAVREPRWVRGREAIQLLDRTGGWVMALPGLHEVLVALTPRPRLLSGSGPGRRAARSRRPRASCGRRRPWRCCGCSSRDGR